MRSYKRSINEITRPQRLANRKVICTCFPNKSRRDKEARKFSQGLWLD